MCDLLNHSKQRKFKLQEHQIKAFNDCFEDLGESIKESLKKSNELAKFNIKTILDYSIEGKSSEEDFNKTVDEIIATIKEAKERWSKGSKKREFLTFRSVLRYRAESNLMYNSFEI